MTQELVITLAEVKKFCQRIFPAEQPIGEGTVMAITIWEDELVRLLDKTFPNEKHCAIVNSQRFIHDPEWAKTARRMRDAEAKRYTYKVLELLATMVGSDNENAVSALKKLANGEPEQKHGLFSRLGRFLNRLLKKEQDNFLPEQLRRLNIMAAARLIADQLSIPYCKEDGAWKRKIMADAIAGVYVDL